MTNKQSGVIVAILTVAFGLIQVLRRGTVEGGLLELVIFILPGLLGAYGLYVWDDELIPRDQRKRVHKKGGREDEGD